MKKVMSFMAFCLVAFAPVAGAYEYALQFTANAGYRGLVVAGYKFEGTNVVVGNCSYYTVSGSSGSGKGGGGHAPTTHTYLQTCRWDLHGNLLSVAVGAPDMPAPLSSDGGKVIFAVNENGDSTGTDNELQGQGFVNTPGAHYTWLTPQNNGVLKQMVYTLSVTLKSDGDVPLDITGVTPSALHGTATLSSTTCIGETKEGATCRIVIAYDDTSLTSDTGQTLDTLRIDLTSNAGAAHDFIQMFTIVMPKRL